MLRVPSSPHSLARSGPSHYWRALLTQVQKYVFPEWLGKWFSFFILYSQVLLVLARALVHFLPPPRSFARYTETRPDPTRPAAGPPLQCWSPRCPPHPRYTSLHPRYISCCASTLYIVASALYIVAAALYIVAPALYIVAPALYIVLRSSAAQRQCRGGPRRCGCLWLSPVAALGLRCL